MDRIAFVEGKVYTEDLMGGIPVYGEGILEISGKKYREWIPWRSKLGALVRKLDNELPPMKGPILYLGAAQGTTVSHLSDLFPDSIVYAVEFSETAFRKLARISKERGNIVPILEDAFHPERYLTVVGKVPTLYQDVSQKDQVGMFLKNADMMLEHGGTGILMIKARSIDITSSPDQIYARVRSDLEAKGWTVKEVIDLGPFQADHACMLLEMR